MAVLRQRLTRRVLAEVIAATIEHGDQPRTLDQYEQACKPLAEKLLATKLAPA